MSQAKIRVMISSRCNDGFPIPASQGGKRLTEWRRELKQIIENQRLFGEQVFEVWINEDAPPKAHDRNSWEVCLKAVRECDILLVLANGSAGWSKDSSGIGICHAEYMEGLRVASGKVFVVLLKKTERTKSSEAERNRSFDELLKTESAFHGGIVETGTELVQRVVSTLIEAVLSLIRRGVREASASRFDRGAALSWSRLGYRERSQQMCKVLSSCICLGGSEICPNLISRPVNGVLIAFKLHAIPASVGIAAAREMVGRPFLNDHALVASLANNVGPVHIIACHRNATETQATNLLGFPDATVVAGSFGIYVADPIQKVQFVFLTNCRDETNLRHQQQRFFEWLTNAGEENLLVERAISRTKIIKAIAEESN